jgi:uncharacterized spore protein YtfJ
MNNFEEVFEKISEFLKSEAKTETIIGQQFKLGEFNCVPVMSVGLGFGGGVGEGNGNAKGESQGSGTGGGAGIGMGPVGFLVSKGDTIQFISAQSGKGLGAAFEKLPELLDKFMTKTKKEEKTI